MGVELSEFDIKYRPRSTIKGQVLDDFQVEMSDVQPRDLGETFWILETDGSLKQYEGKPVWFYNLWMVYPLPKWLRSHSLPPIMKPNTKLFYSGYD